MLNIYKKFFAGTYYFILKFDYDDRFVIDKNSAMTSLVLMSFTHFCAYMGVLIFVGAEAFMSAVYINAAVLFTFFSVGYLLFVVGSKYEESVAFYKARIKETTRVGISFNLCLFAILICSIAFKIIT